MDSLTPKAFQFHPSSLVTTLLNRSIVYDVARCLCHEGKATTRPQRPHDRLADIIAGFYIIRMATLPRGQVSGPPSWRQCPDCDVPRLSKQCVGDLPPGLPEPTSAMRSHRSGRQGDIEYLARITVADEAAVSLPTCAAH